MRCSNIIQKNIRKRVVWSLRQCQYASHLSYTQLVWLGRSLRTGHRFYAPSCAVHLERTGEDVVVHTHIHRHNCGSSSNVASAVPSALRIFYSRYHVRTNTPNIFGQFIIFVSTNFNRLFGQYSFTPLTTKVYKFFITANLYSERVSMENQTLLELMVFLW